MPAALSAQTVLDCLPTSLMRRLILMARARATFQALMSFPVPRKLKLCSTSTLSVRMRRSLRFRLRFTTTIRESATLKIQRARMTTALNFRNPTFFCLALPALARLILRRHWQKALRFPLLLQTLPPLPRQDTLVRTLRIYFCA